MFNPEMPKPEIKINLVPAAEITENFSRSGGAGGQNVNKVSTKVELRWTIANSNAFSAEQKFLLKKNLANRINREGELIVVCQEARAQGQNRNLAFEKLQRLVAEALIVEKERIATKPSFSAQQQRLEIKKKTSQKKSGRRLPDIE